MAKSAEEILQSPGLSAPGKVTQAEANYRPAEGQPPCANCNNFVLPDKCQLVKGKIAPDATCDLYVEASPLAEDEALFG